MSLFSLVWLIACAVGEAPVTTTLIGGMGGTGGTGGGDTLPCGMDCAKVETAPCKVAVCNTGQLEGPLNTCIVVPAPNGTVCDDGKFCTTKDVCDNGVCGGTEKNTCGMTPNPCIAVLCYEDSKTCDTTPVNDGTECTPFGLCEVDGVCHLGECIGHPKDCTFSPLNECNKVSCDPNTGKCVGTPDDTKDDFPCFLSGDLCSVEKTCKTGQCQGGAPKDCSKFNVGCEVGACDADTGLCGARPAPVGTPCVEGIPECHVGQCDVKGVCTPSAAADGATCNDHNACTKSDTCASGVCSGTPIAGCTLYLNESFENCSNGWTFGGDWQCGAPTMVGPPAAHTGTNCMATQIAGVYHINQSFNNAVADSPPIDLTTATNPMLSFWAWDHTEGGTFDGWNLKVSIDGGQSFTEVTTVTPAYPLNILGQPSWGGDHSGDGWQNYTADLTNYKGHSVILRFAFRSDAATVYPGVYIDDVVVAEPAQLPLYIVTTSPLPDTYAGMDYAVQIVKTGGTGSVQWSITPITNAGWLTIDGNGVLKGPATNVGPVSVLVHVNETALPSNFAEKVFTFNVKDDIYYTSWENCPNGWTLTGDWQCGVPTTVGPATAYAGTQCIATKIASLYSDLQSYDTTTATSPDIDLTNVPGAVLTFRMWVDTEGSSYDGGNLQISTDGGMTWSIITDVTPMYNLMVAGKPAWGSHQTALGWQLVKTDLSPYAGGVSRLRFAFQSDSSGQFAGIYVDDFFIQIQ